MSGAADTIEESFRALVAKKRFRSISVKEVCELAGVSRKTFYAHFVSKDDVIDKIFRRDVLQPVFDLGRLLSNDELMGLSHSVFSRIFDAVHDDGAFYRSLAIPMRGDDFTFIYVTTGGFRELYSKMLYRLGKPNMSTNTDYIVSYFASAHASLLEKWICEGYPVPADQMVDIYMSVALPFWNALGGGRLLGDKL